MTADLDSYTKVRQEEGNPYLKDHLWRKHILKFIDSSCLPLPFKCILLVNKKIKKGGGGKHIEVFLDGRRGMSGKNRTLASNLDACCPNAEEEGNLRGKTKDARQECQVEKRCKVYSLTNWKNISGSAGFAKQPEDEKNCRKRFKIKRATDPKLNSCTSLRLASHIPCVQQTFSKMWKAVQFADLFLPSTAIALWTSQSRSFFRRWVWNRMEIHERKVQVSD